MPGFNEDTVPYNQLLLDPNNYRHQDDPDFVYADEKRFHEQGVQDRAFRRLREEESLIQLKHSFMTNGFIPVERLVVRPYPYVDNCYLVLEGNRRLGALRWIADDHEAGVDVPKTLLAALEAVPVMIVEGEADPSFYESLMGVRHVSGIRQWGGYQRARLVVRLKDDHGFSSAEVADRLGMSAHEVNRRYRAFKALQQMEEDENFGDYARSGMYPLFHEAVSLPVVREWLGWDEDEAQFTNEEQFQDFYQLITPNEEEDTPSRDPKITTYSQVRELRHIMPNAEARRILLDPARSFFDAVSVAKREELSRLWTTQVAEAIIAMEAISVLDLQKLSSDDLKAIERVKDVATNLLNTYKKLVA
jgi:hypothetical protein